MSNKFKNVPVEDDTNIIFSLEVKLEPYDVLYQKWSWEGITAESFIFDSKDVSHLSDEEIIADVKTSPAVKEDSQVTLKRSESGFVFVNFNFAS
jgi:hypothetical protein